MPGNGQFAPVCFAAGAIGNDTALYVSAQHRMLIRGWRCELLLEEPEVLCAAVHMCNGNEIYRARVDRLTYYHIMFDKHQLVYSNEVPSESFFVGDYQAGADTRTYDELITLFPDLAEGDHPGVVPARPFVRGFEAALLMADH